MRLAELLGTWHGTRAANRVLGVALLAVCGVVVVQSLQLARRERLVVLVPPALQAETVVGRTRADAPYHTAWAGMLAGMLGNVSPGNAGFLKERLDPLLDPAIFTAVNQAIEQQLDQIRRDRITLAFEPRKILHEPGTGKTFVTGYSVVTGLGGSTERSVRTFEFELAIDGYRLTVRHLASYDGEARTRDRPASSASRDGAAG